MAKQVRSYGGVDRISNLPDPILCHILSFLSIRQAVSTSILSTRWRYLFASLSKFNLGDCNIVTSPTSIRKIFNFVDRLLLFNTRTNIEKLLLEIRKDCSRVYSWISVAVLHRGLQQLNLTIFPQCISSSMQSTRILPAALFTCNTLVVLKLMIMGLVLYVPNDVFLPKLKILDLSFIEFPDDDSVRKLISGCIMLEHFILMPCTWRNINQLNICHPFLKALTISSLHCSNPQESLISWIVIDAPNLVRLNYFNIIAAGCSLVNLRSLIKANILFELSWDESDQRSELVTAEFLKAIANVKSLGLSPSSLMLLLQKKEPLPVFGKLVEFKILYDYSPCSWKKECIHIVQNMSMPNLARLALPREQFLSYIPENAPLFSYLKGMEITYFDERDELETIKCFLKNATALEKLTIRTSHWFDNKEKPKIAKELLASPRKSKNCCILVI